MAEDMSKKLPKKHIHDWNFVKVGGFICTYCGMMFKETIVIRESKTQRPIRVWMLPYEARPTITVTEREKRREQG